jgi:hypothetical protein
VIWSGVGSCRGWYSDHRAWCYADCQTELDHCLQNGTDPQLCRDTKAACDTDCNYQYDVVWAPYWGRCTF